MKRSEENDSDPNTLRVVTASERIAVAARYLDALLTHDSSEVSFHPTAIRVEAGIKTGYSGPHLHASLDKGPQYRLIQEIRNIEWAVEHSSVVADYLLDAGLLGRRLATVRIHETFLIPPDDPRIHLINARIRLEKGPLMEKLRNYGLLVKYVVTTQWRKLRGSTGKRNSEHTP